jgi:hypothetical protein
VLFLSYAEEDGETAREIAQRLNDHGLEVWSWQDPDRWGRRFMWEIEDAIKSADAFLVLLSPNLLRSDWCRRERDVALRREQRLQREQRDRVFIHVLQIANMEDEDVGFLASYDLADLTDPQREDAVIARLARRLGAAAGPGPADSATPGTRAAASPPAAAGEPGSAATPRPSASSPAAGAEVARMFRNREDDLEKVLRDLTISSGGHFWLVIAPPQLGKSWFLRRVMNDPAVSESAGWDRRLVDLRDLPAETVRDCAALLAALFRLPSPAAGEQDTLRAIARQIVVGRKPCLCLLDSAELLDKATAAALRRCLSQIRQRVQDARRDGVRLALIVATRRDDDWRGVTPAPRLSALPLTEFKVSVVAQALEDLAARTDSRFSPAELTRHAEQVHQLTEGLPALLAECLQWIESEQWLEMDRLATQALFDDLTRQYIRSSLLARDSLFPGGQGEEDEPLPLEQAYRLLSPYRLFTKSHLRHHLESDPAFGTELRDQRGFMEDLWKAVSGTALLLRPLNEPWQAIHPTIRRLLFKHYYISDEHRGQAHIEARKFVEVWADRLVGKEQVTGLVECLWHEATALRLLKSAEMERRLCDSARTLSLAIEPSTAYSLEELRDYAARQLKNDDELEEIVSNVDGLFTRLVEIVVMPQ